MNKKTLIIVAVAAAAGLVIYFLMRRRQQTVSNPAESPIFVSTPKPVQSAPFVNPDGINTSFNTGVNVASSLTGLFTSLKNVFSTPVNQTNSPLLSLAPPSGTFESSGDFVNGDFANYASAAGSDNIDNNDQSLYYSSYGTI